MTDVTNYIAGIDDPQQSLMIILDNLIMTQFDFQAKIRFSIPFYYNKSWVCYLNPIKNDGVELCFLRANELANTDGLLDFKDRKQVAGISYYTTQQISTNSPVQLLQEALILDETVKYESKRQKK